jgi:hypothetical protein
MAAELVTPKGVTSGERFADRAVCQAVIDYSEALRFPRAQRGAL